MDQKTLASLDPKLRETYERVMGMATPSSASAGNPPPAPIPPPAQTSRQMDSAMYVSPSTQQAELTALQPTMTSAAMPKPIATNTHPNELIQSLPSPATANYPLNNTGLSPALRILYFVAGIIFFVVYAIFWLKIFKYPLPFLPF